MNELTQEKVMTTRELAEVLGVDISTVKKTLKRLEDGSAVLHHFTKDKYGNTCFLFTEKQAVIIKQEIQKHHNLATRQIDTVTSELEENQTIANAMMILQRRNEELKRRMEEAENKNKLLEPKAQVYDDFISRDKFCNFRDGANYIGVTQSVFMDFLKSRYIYKNSIGEYRAYSEYADYFALRPYQKGTEKTGQQLMLNLKGLEYFKAKISA